MTVLAVGVPKELKIGERRVGLTPKGVEFLTKHSVPVFVEKEAGLKSGFSDHQYEAAGARIVEERADLWRKASVIEKVKEPMPEEFGFIQSKHIIFTFLHLASPASRPFIEALLRSGATAIGYEMVEVGNDHPILKPMSEVAGTLAAYFAGVLRNCVAVENNQIAGLEQAKRMMDELASRYPSVPKGLNPGQVIVLGGGHVGREAVQMAARMGGSVCLSEISDGRRTSLGQYFARGGLEVKFLDPEECSSYEAALGACDVMIAAVHKTGRKAPLIIDALLLKKISRKRKKVILDVSIDQGGNVAESRLTSYEEPVYLDSMGNLRYAVANMPSLCGRVATVLLEEAALKYTFALSGGLEAAVKQYGELTGAVNIRGGSVVHTAVREAHRFH